MNEKASTYALSADVHESIFRSDIVPLYFAAISGPSTEPTAVILGGQPGAGKSSLLKEAERHLNALGPTLTINGDELRVFHTYYDTLQRTDPENAARFTDLDSGRWVEKLIAESIIRRVNLVIESTMRNPDVFVATAQRLHEAGYAIEARAMAVNERVSWQGVHMRYEAMKEKGEAARFTVRESHDAGAIGMLKTLDRIESERLADRVLIGSRDGAIIYDNSLEDGAWKKPTEASKTVEQERNRLQSYREIEKISHNWQIVLARMEKRQAEPSRIETVRAIASSDLKHFRSQSRREIFERNPDPLKLYDELYRNAVRDASLRPIGNLEAHAQGRLAQSYAALKLIEAARDNGALPEGATIVATGARVQDKQGAREFPAAHRIPADLAVRAVDGSQHRLTEHFGVELNRIVIERAVFAPTDRVSRIANVADSWVEQGGMKNTLVHAANEVASGKMTANEAMTRIVEPGYQGSVIRAARKIDRNFSYVERTAINRAIVDERGRPLRASAYDLKLRTADLETRAQAKAMMEQTFDVYGNFIVLGPGERQKVDQLVEGIDQNERNLDLSRKPLIPAAVLPDLTAAEIAARVQASDQVQGRRAEIEHLSRIVYGSSTALSDAVQAIDNNPAVASSSAATIRNAPEQVGELAGTPGGWIRSPGPERKSAEAHVPQLAAALEGYGQTLSSEQTRVVAAHSADQRRIALEVPAPSPQLSATLRSPLSAQAARFQSHPESRKELERLSVALSRRLAPQDHTALRTGDYAAAQKSLGLSAAQMKHVAQTRQQVLEANRGQIQQREIAQQQHTGPVITR